MSWITIDNLNPTFSVKDMPSKAVPMSWITIDNLDRTFDVKDILYEQRFYTALAETSY